MDADQFDMLATRVRGHLTRRVGLGALAAVSTSAILASAPAAGKHKKRKKRTCPTCPTPPVNVCAGKNWCVDRSQTCGPTGGEGRCLVEVTGGNLCAKIEFQTTTCADCVAPGCVDCRCALAAGGGDRCNNGADGEDFICVRAV